MWPHLQKCTNLREFLLNQILPKTAPKTVRVGEKLLKLVDLSHLAKKAFSIRSTPSGHLLIQEETSNDLLILDSEGNETTRFKAKAKFGFSNPHLRNASYSGEKDIGLWFCGGTSVCKVNLGQLTFKELKGILQSKGSKNDAVALKATFNKDLSEIFLLNVFENMFYLTYMNMNNSQVHHIDLVKEVSESKF